MFFRERARKGSRAQAQAYISVPPFSSSILSFSVLPQTDRRRPRCEAKRVLAFDVVNMQSKMLLAPAMKNTCNPVHQVLHEILISFV